MSDGAPQIPAPEVTPTETPGPAPEATSPEAPAPSPKATPPEAPAPSPAPASGIWVFVERGPDGFRDVSIELLGKARSLAESLGQEMVAVVFGTDASAADGLLPYGPDRVIVLTDPAYDRFDSLAFTAGLAGLMTTTRPSILLLPATRDGQDLAGRLAVRLRTGLTAHATSLELDEQGVLVGWVPGFGGGIEAAITCPELRPQMCTIRPGVFDLPAPGEVRGSIEERPARLTDGDIGTRQVSFALRGDAIDITKAEVLMVGGRGTGGDLSVLRDLALRLSGQVGATRVALDEGWIEREQMVGQTGVTTKPRFALIAGVSGAVQFTVGIDGAERIVAINRDPDAQIFEHADLGLVGDLEPILLKLRDRLGDGA